MAPRVLVVEDEPDVAEVVQAVLEGEGLETRLAPTGLEALEGLDSYDPDLMVLDILLPDMDGFSVCQEVRRRSELPILVLSARNAAADKVTGLDLGADDYLAKPFDVRELAARVRALLRRTRSRTELRSGPLALLLETHEAYLEGRPLHLTRLEFNILRALMEAGPKVLTRQALLDRAWGNDYFGLERTVDAHIRNLRKKLDEARPGFDPIVAVRGIGYRLAT